MENFFDILSEFFKSDLAKSYGWLLAFLFVAGILIFGYLMNLLYMKVIVPAKLLEANDAAQKGKKATEELEKCKEKIKNLEKENEELHKKLNHFKFAKEFENLENEEFETSKNGAFSKFT